MLLELGQLVFEHSLDLFSSCLPTQIQYDDTISCTCYNVDHVVKGRMFKGLDRL